MSQALACLRTSYHIPTLKVVLRVGKDHRKADYKAVSFLSPTRASVLFKFSEFKGYITGSNLTTAMQPCDVISGCSFQSKIFAPPFLKSWLCPSYSIGTRDLWQQMNCEDKVCLHCHKCLATRAMTYIFHPIGPFCGVQPASIETTRINKLAKKQLERSTVPWFDHSSIADVQGLPLPVSSAQS